MAVDPWLRERALEALRADKAHISGDKTHALLEELHTHQLELEMQNDELRATQLELQAAKDSYAELYELAPVAYLKLAEDDTIRQANLTAVALFGKTRSELVGSRLSQFIHRDDQDVWYLYRTQLLDSTSLRDCELRVNASVNVLTVQIATHSIHRPNGAAPTLLVSLTDVTQRRAAEQKLQASELQFQSLLASLDAVVWSANLEGSYLYLNRAVESVYGLPHDVCLADKDFWLKAILLEDRGIAERANDQLREQGHAAAEYRIRRPDGNIRWLLDRKFLVKDGGKITGLGGIGTDITERKLAEEALRGSEDRFRQITENINKVFWLIDWESQRILYVSPAYEHLWGRGVQTLYDYPLDWTKALHDDDRERVETSFFQQAALGNWCQEYRVVLPDGTQRWIRDRAFPIRNEAGKVVRMAGIAEDITDLKDSERELRESEERYRRLVVNSPFCVQELAMDGSFLSMNPAGLKTMGFACESDVRGIPCLDIVCNQDKVAVRERLEQARQGLASSFEFSTRTGQVFDSCLVPLIDSDGKISKIMGITQDITAKKQTENALRESEERYRRIFEASGEAIISLTCDGLVETWNQAAQSMFGYSVDEMRGSSVARLVPAERSAELLHSQQFQSGRTVKGFETQRLTKDGRLLDVVLTLQPILDNEGCQNGVVGTVRDVTDFNRSQEKLRQREAELEHVSRASSMGEMALALTHELNQPLGAAATYAGRCIDLLAAESARPGDLLEPLRIAHTQIMRAGEIIAKLKSFVSKSKPKMEGVDLNHLASRVDDLVPRHLSYGNVSRHLELHPHPVFVMVDALQIEQVLVNLMTNALHSISETPEVSGKIVIRIAVKEDRAVVSVIDNGKGIANVQLEQIFEPYQTSKRDGLGMGLCICRTILNNHGGRIWATNSPKGGAHLTFSLPLVPK